MGGDPRSSEPLPVIRIPELLQPTQVHFGAQPVPSAVSQTRHKLHIPGLEPSSEWVSSIDELLGIQRKDYKPNMPSDILAPHHGFHDPLSHRRGNEPGHKAPGPK